jgi:hypothetical protein
LGANKEVSMAKTATMQLLRHRMSFTVNLGYLNEYYETMEALIAKENSEYDANIKRNALELPEHEREDYLNEFAQDDAYLARASFPRMLRRQVFVAAYDYLESWSNAFCNCLGKLANSSLKITDLSGQGMERVKSYLSKVVTLSYDFKSKDWQSINLYNDTRNTLVHLNGKVKPEKQKDFIKLFKSVQGLRLDEHREIVIESAAISQELQDIESFYKTIMSLAYKKYAPDVTFVP